MPITPSHPTALAWFGGNAGDGWASCPITRNGRVRIMTHPGYPNTHSVREVVERLRSATVDRSHAFWADSESFLDESLVDATRVHGPRKITDVYLLALAVNRGRLVTFDTSIAIESVRGATSRHVLTL
ncbi:type II toxin-antitoxin system VapC family toxin [soil metagenome]